MKHIKTLLKKNIRILRKYKKTYTSVAEKSEGIMWFTDNFHIIEKNFTAVSKALKNKKISLSVPSSIEICKELCTGGVLPKTQDIISFLLKKNTTTAFLQTLPTAIAFTLIGLITESINTNEDMLINSIRSLFVLPDIDFGEILYQVSETEKLLCRDPVGVYRKMSEQTKDIYRTAICKMAEKEGLSEISVATRLLEQAKKENKHIGFFLDITKDRQNTGKLLFATEAILPLIAGVILSIVTKQWYVLFLIYLPLWEALKFITDFIFSHIPARAPVFKMDFSAGIPDSEKTVIAISTLLPSAGCAKDLCENIKNLYLSNCRDNTCICILADLKSSSTPTKESDNADIKSIRRAVDILNSQCSDKIILAIRKRIYSESEKEYTGYERKRGAIISLAKLIQEGKNDFFILHGDTEKMVGAKYIMALDSDTKMPLGSLSEIVSIAAHPINRPVISVSEQRVTQGYGIISPRVETDVKSACKTHFSSVMAGNGGLPAYTSAVREKYMDLFSESIFSGKGLIDIKTFNTLMPDRFPEQRILSHDILEGIILRTAFAGDITLTDSFPSNENAYFRRLHRWIRGDVQNFPFILKRKNSVPSGLKLIFNVVLGFADDEEIEEDDLEALKSQDMLTSALSELGENFPSLKKYLVDERDEFIAKSILSAPGNTVVAVVGAAHTVGMHDILVKGEAKKEDLQELKEIPKGSKAGKFIGLAIPAFIIGMIVFTLFRDLSAGFDQIGSWVIYNGALSALGTALAGGHILTVLVSFIVAPITSLDPLTAAGWFAGLTEAYLRKPAVKDFESLSDDLSSIKGLWKNRITRLLLIVVFSNLGSSIGTFIGGADIFSIFTKYL